MGDDSNFLAGGALDSLETAAPFQASVNLDSNFPQAGATSDVFITKLISFFGANDFSLDFGFKAATKLKIVANDDLASPMVIRGFSIFDFDNSQASSDGMAHDQCTFSGMSEVYNDLWYLWYNEDNCQQVLISTCNITTIPTKIALYQWQGQTLPQQTADSLMDCQANNCDQQTRMLFAPQQESYLIRIGSNPGATSSEMTGQGRFQISCVTSSKGDVNVASGTAYDKQQLDSKKLSDGALAGIIIASIVVAGALVAGIIVIVKKNSSKTIDSRASPSYADY